MKRLFSRRSGVPTSVLAEPQEEALLPIAAEEDIDPKPASRPETFLLDNEEALGRSRLAWQQIARMGDFVEDEEVLARFQRGVAEYQTPEYTRGDERGAGRIDRVLGEADARRLATETGIMFLITLRYFRRVEPTPFKAATKTSNFVRSVTNPFIKKVINTSLPPTAISKLAVELNGSLNVAEAQAQLVLENLTHQIQEHPPFAQEMVDYMKNGGSQSELGQELRRVVAVDWRHPDPQESILREFLERIKKDPDFHLPGFINAVVENDRNRRFEQVREMARFALVQQGLDAPTDHDVRHMLHTSQPKWTSFEQINKAYEEYSKNASRDIEAAVVSLVAGISKNDSHFKMRAHRTWDEIFEMSRSVTDIFLDRFSRRMHSSIRPANLPTEHDLKVEEVIAPVAEEEKPQRTLYIAKRSIKGEYELEAADSKELESIIDEFGLGNLNPGTREDIKLMVKSLLEEPLGPGTKKLASAKAKIRVGGNLINLRRLSPLDRKIDGRQSKESLRYRVSYGISNGGVLIVDILNHDEFDKKYI